MKRTLAIAVTALAALAAPALGAKPEPKNLSIGATPTTIKFGGVAVLAGKLNGSNNANRPVTVEQDPFPLDTFTNAGSTTTNATGDWLLGVKPTANTRYRARSGNADSKTVDVMVRPAITLKLSDRTPATGQRVRFSGTLCPEHDGVAIALQKRTATGSWRTVAKPVLKDVAGATCSSYSKGRRVRSNSAYRARFLGDADHVAGNSRVRRARVH